MTWLPPRKGQPLTPAEQRVLSRLVLGETNKEIAESLGRSLGLVKRVVSRIYIKLGVRNRAAAVMAAKRKGLTRPSRQA